MSLSSPGVGSGLDVKTIVDALVKAEITPLQTRHDKQLTGVNTELSAVSQLKSTLANLQESLSTLSDLNKFYIKKFSLSDQGYLSSTVSPEAAKGTYRIEIQNLAQQQSLATSYFTNNTTSIGSSGTMSINFGSYNADKTVFTANPDISSININISPDNNSLNAVRDAINKSNSDVTASLVEDSQGSRLVLSSSHTGEQYAMKISGDITALNYDPTTGVNSLTETMAAQNSTVLINGLAINQSTNELNNAISGVTLNLTKAEAGKIITMTVEDNKDQVTSLVNDFIKKYNDSITFLTTLTGYNAETKQRGVFQGDPQFRSLKLSINKWATNPIANSNSAIQSLADLGIKTNKQGLLEMKQTEFDKAIADHYSEIGGLFAKTASATDGNIRVKSLGNKVPSGTYAVDLDQFTPGVSMSGTIGSNAATSPDGITLNGSGNLSSLSLEVRSGSSGYRGTIMVNDGLAVLLDEMIDTYMSNKGDLNQRKDQLDKQVNNLAKTQDRIDIRKTQVETRYTKQFNALDLLLTNMQSISAAITQLMDSLPKLTIK